MNDDVGILRLLRDDMNNTSGSSVEEFNDVATSPPGGRVPIISNVNGQWNGGPSGITLQAIGLTLGGGLCVSFLSIVAFGLAVMARNATIAPRCATRHPNTIWRSWKDMYGENKNDDDNDDDDDDDGERKKRRRRIRDRAFSPLSFMPRDPKQSLTPKLAQEEEQQNDSQNNINQKSKRKHEKHAQDRGNPFLGWIPWTLHLSYDRMLRGIPGTGTRDGGMGGKLLGVNLDAIVLFRYHALCLRVTAVVTVISICIILPLNMSACDGKLCDPNLTDYGRTTIANIVNNMAQETLPNGMLAKFNIFSTIFWTEESLPHLMRLYIISMCSWYITYFALRSIRREWRENLVLRRVYYLEADHYGNRQTELDRTVNRQYDEGMADNNNNNDGDGGEEGIERGIQDENGKTRDPWMPNPEFRDTVPSVELYSVLVGGLPSLPDEVVNSKDVKTALGFSNQATIDWQLAVATTFFDHCVPNQPGFSSSVVAVTILPGAPELAKAWRKWYCAAATLRRLRFIRQVIKEKRHYDIDDVESNESPRGSKRVVLVGSASPGEQPSSSSPRVAFLDEDSSPGSSHHREVYGTAENTADVDHVIFSSLNYGHEQQAVYSREMAQGAAACCPNGCGEGRVRRLPIDRLLEMEDDTIVRLEKAQYELQCAQMKAAVSIVDWGDKTDWRTSKEGENLSNIDTPELPTANGHEQPQSAPPIINAMNGNWLNGKGSILPSNSSVSLSSMARVGGKGALSPSRGPISPLFVVNETVRHDAILNGSESGSDRTPSRQSNVAIRRLTPIVSPVPGATTLLRMNSEGRFLFNNAINGDDDDSIRNTVNSGENFLRRRANTAQSALTDGGQASERSSNQWEQVNSILKTTDDVAPNEEIETGVWVKPTFSFKSFASSVKSDILLKMNAAVKWTKGKTDPLTSKVAKSSTYAVVTFSSRQAAVAARHCLADGRGVNRWLSAETVPVPPLADAAPLDIITCRGCCRPVTLNVNENQLMVRRYLALTSLACIYIFYTIPISLAQSLVSPKNLGELPLFQKWMNEYSFLSADILSGLVTALLYTLFFALCPVMFKAIANSGSHATSVQEAEKYALKYYWYFMLVTAFCFTGLADAVTKIWESSFDDIDETIEDLVKKIASWTPLTTAATWLNWIIVRTTMTLPLQYLLQINTFVFSCLGWKCCARCVMGGGPGGPIPYRIYVDGGVVFLCVVALAPQSPLVAPVALLYYFFCVPLWRRNCIFMYRPKFDSGGERWPFLSDMLITSIFMGQFLLTLQMVLADAYGPALFSSIPALPTYLYRNFLISCFRRAYDDAGLLQTSLLDGWDNAIPTSLEKREEFRRFLVDAHKAAYIPVCIAGGATNILTAEPAVVIPSENDDMLGYDDVDDNFGGEEGPPSPQLSDPSHKDLSYWSNGEGDISNLPQAYSPATAPINQHGVCMRRTVTFGPALPLPSPASPAESHSSESPATKMWRKIQDSASASADPVQECNQS